jgi:hypothetical protein
MVVSWFDANAIASLCRHRARTIVRGGAAKS